MSANAKPVLYFCLFMFSIYTLTMLKTMMLPENKVTVEDTVSILDLDVPEFNNYMIQFNKSYSGFEYHVRLENFKESLKEIARLNSLGKGTVYGLTKFSDMSAEEFANTMLRARDDQNCPIGNGNKRKDVSCVDETTTFIPHQQLNLTVDWRKEGVIGPVRNQRLCNGCWAFTTSGVIESMAKIRKLIHEELSIQEILDCVLDNADHDGCEGGNIYNTMEVICDDRKSLVTEKAYPLNLRRESCKWSSSDKGIKITKFGYKCDVPDHDIMEAVMNGPVIAIVNAHNWRNYVGGIIRWACPPPTKFVHDIQIVGYDTVSDTVPFYIIRNSWGELFGEGGYVRVAMNHNVCGISGEVGVIYDVYQG